MDFICGSNNYKYFTWTEKSEAIDYINKIDKKHKVMLIGHSYGGDTADGVAHSVEREIDVMITLDPVSHFNFGGSKPEKVKKWYNVIADNDKLELNDLVAAVGGNWGEEDGAINVYCYADHNVPLVMLIYLKLLILKGFIK